MRKFLPAAVLAFSVAAAGASSVQAHGLIHNVTTYYANASKADVVGVYTIYCDGHSKSWGSVTVWSDSDDYPCP